MGGTPCLEQGKSVRSSPTEEGGVAETRSDELTTAPIHCTAVGEEVEWNIKLGPGRRKW